MSEYSEYFLNSNSSVIEFDCFELSHSAFSEVYYLVRNASLGVSVTHEDDSDKDYQYCPMRLSLSNARDDLDFILKIELGDQGEIASRELENVRAADKIKEFPKVIYRTYRSDNLDAPMYGPVELQIEKFNLTPEACAFEAKAPSANISKTGELYTLPRFPMLRGLL